jgi:hypothetical protein
MPRCYHPAAFISMRLLASLMARPRLSAPLSEPELTRHERRAGGVYYTPAEVVRYIVERTLSPDIFAGSPPAARILDPACGAGAFLSEAFSMLLSREEAATSRTPASDERFDLLKQSIFGIDRDAEAVQKTRLALATAALGANYSAAQCAAAANELRRNIVVGDALLHDLEQLFPHAVSLIDVIVGNPPYVNIREIAKSLSAAQQRQLKQRYKSARGNYDLYVLFLERSLGWLREDGRLGMIVPNKLAGLAYARPCRELLLRETTLEHVADLSTLPVFPEAGVYPLVVICSKRPPGAKHEIGVAQIATVGELTSPLATARIPQASLAPAGFVFTSDLALESRRSTLPLGEIARLHSGASGYSAAELATLLVERSESDGDDSDWTDFIVSRNIKRYAVTLGDVRFLRERYRRPRLRLDSRQLSPLKRELYRGRKIVIAGMSRRIEAAWDDVGRALGVQVYAANRLACDPFYLLALLNSRLLTFLFQTRFAAKRLAGGYFSLNKGQLVQLPIAIIDEKNEADRSRHARLARLAERLHDLSSVAAERSAIEAEIDRLVYELYRLTAAEIARVEAHFAGLPARAA